MVASTCVKTGVPILSHVERIGVFVDNTESSTRARLTLSGACPRRNSSLGIIGAGMAKCLKLMFGDDFFESGVQPSTLAQSCREDRCLCRLHGIEHPGQTDTFRSLSETELEPRNHRCSPQHSPSRVERIGVFVDYTESSTRARLTLSGACPRRNSSLGIIGAVICYINFAY
ncbi:hypothetical protein DPMN_031314 [Dreissena polymorpha]|uniref:Uncharacterized protein n=1 Tax=Dreissena polymorpha TaxID=45954 RepID=A0A9D4M1Z4_DREPO|nr:hypothetical protein DPMN_031314 [Dreissena polymorpha]